MNNLTFFGASGAAAPKTCIFSATVNCSCHGEPSDSRRWPLAVRNPRKQPRGCPSNSYVCEKSWNWHVDYCSSCCWHEVCFMCNSCERRQPFNITVFILQEEKMDTTSRSLRLAALSSSFRDPATSQGSLLPSAWVCLIETGRKPGLGCVGENNMLAGKCVFVFFLFYFFHLYKWGPRCGSSSVGTHLPRPDDDTMPLWKRTNPWPPRKLCSLNIIYKNM